MSASIEQRVKLVQGELLKLVAMHESGTYPEGPEALNAKISNIFTENKLWEGRTVQVDNVGVFPGNRENSGLVSFDVQGLLFETFYQNGYNPEKWDCCAITILEEWKKRGLSSIKNSTLTQTDFCHRSPTWSSQLAEARMELHLCEPASFQLFLRMLKSQALGDMYL